MTGIVNTTDPSLLRIQGGIDCSSSGSTVLSMSTSGGRFSGFFGLGETLSSLQVGTSRRLAVHHSSFPSKISVGMSSRRHLQSLPDFNSTAVVISNPIVCMKSGDSIVFDVSDLYFPVYVKDSLLNTNPNFDYSSFRELSSLLSRNITISSFAFTFKQNGTYVFRLSSQSVATTVIKVVPSSINCSTDSPYVDYTNKNLVTMGVLSNTSIVLSPDWGLVMGLLFGMMGLIISVVGFLYYFRKRAWSSQVDIAHAYRVSHKSKSDMAPSKGGLFRKGKVYAADNDDALAGALNDDLEAKIPNEEKDVDFDDEMQVPELARHMQAHHDQIDRRLIDQNDLLESLHASLKREVDELKNLLTTSALEMGGGADKDKVQSLLNKLKSDINTRASFDIIQQSTSSRILQLLERVSKLLDVGGRRMAEEITNEIKDKGFQAKAYELPVNTIESTLLHDMIEEVEYLRNYIADTLVPTVEAEKRRMEGVESSVNHILQSGSIDIPHNVISSFHKMFAAEMMTDSAIAEFSRGSKGFSDRSVPRFVEGMIAKERHFAQTLAVDFEKGNLSAVDNDCSQNEAEMTPLLDDLKTAIEELMNFVGSNAEVVAELQEAAVSLRSELLAFIDDAVDKSNADKQPSSSVFDMRMFAPLIEALKEALPSPQPTAQASVQGAVEQSDSEDDVVPSEDSSDSGDDAVREFFDEDDDDNSTIFNFLKSATNLASYNLMPAFGEIDRDVVDAVMNSELTIAQKDEILTSAENGKQFSCTLFLGDVINSL